MSVSIAAYRTGAGSGVAIEVVAVDGTSFAQPVVPWPPVAVGGPGRRVVRLGAANSSNFSDFGTPTPATNVRVMSFGPGIAPKTHISDDVDAPGAVNGTFSSGSGSYAVARYTVALVDIP